MTSTSTYSVLWLPSTPPNPECLWTEVRNSLDPSKSPEESKECHVWMTHTPLSSSLYLKRNFLSLFGDKNHSGVCYISRNSKVVYDVFDFVFLDFRIMTFLNYDVLGVEDLPLLNRPFFFGHLPPSIPTFHGRPGHQILDTWRRTREWRRQEPTE